MSSLRVATRRSSTTPARPVRAARAMSSRPVARRRSSTTPAQRVRMSRRLLETVPRCRQRRPLQSGQARYCSSPAPPSRRRGRSGVRTRPTSLLRSEGARCAAASPAAHQVLKRSRAVSSREASLVRPCLVLSRGEYHIPKATCARYDGFGGTQGIDDPLLPAALLCYPNGANADCLRGGDQNHLHNECRPARDRAHGQCARGATR